MRLLTPLVVLLSIAAACGNSDHRVGAGINLGKQNAAVTLVAGNNNNVAGPNGGITAFLRVVANASGSTMTGLDSTGAADGDVVYIRNESATGTVTLTNADSNSLAANRFVMPGGTSATIAPGKTVAVEWDLTNGAWMLVLGGGAGIEIVNNKQRTAGTAPVISSCGTAPSAVAGNDYSGRYTTGSAATTCTITFASTYGTAPSCILGVEGGATLPTYTVSATAITVSVDIASTTYNYICVGH